MTPTYPRILPDRDRFRRFYLDEAVDVTLANGDVLTIPKGYRFNGHSVPLVFRPLFPVDGRDLPASLIHDYLIDMESLHRYNRKFMDNEYTRFMNMPEYVASRRRALLMPIAVRLWGYLRFDIWGDNRGVVK